MDCRADIYNLVSQGYSLSDPYVIKSLYKYGYRAKEIASTLNKHFDIDITIEKEFIQALLDLHKDRDLDNLPDANNYWHKLNIDIAPLIIDLKDYILSDPYRPNEHASFDINTGGVWTLNSNKLFSKEWLQYLENDYSIFPGHVQLFYKNKNAQHSIAHVDVSSTGTLHGGAINWTLDPDDAEMVWYETPNYKHTREVSTTTNNQSKDWPILGLKEVDRCHVGQEATLVRTDVPHTVDIGITDRWAVSFRIVTALSWQAHVTVLNQYFQNNQK